MSEKPYYCAQCNNPEFLCFCSADKPRGHRTSDAVGITDGDGHAWAYGKQGGLFAPGMKLYAHPGPAEVTEETVDKLFYKTDGQRSEYWAGYKAALVEIRNMILAESPENKGEPT